MFILFFVKFINRFKYSYLFIQKHFKSQGYYTMLSKKKIKDLIEKNEDYLEALAEFDRTGQLRKVTRKERVTFTIDMDLMRKFRNYCEKNNQKMSNVIEKMIKDKLNL